MSAPAWWPGGLRNDHAGPLNAKVHRQLRGIYKLEGVAEALVELLRSEEEFDQHTRAALADALEADLRGDRSAVRFRLVKPAHRARVRTDVLDQMVEMQEIASRYRTFREQGLTWDQAAHELQKLGYGKSKVAEAIDYAAKAVVRVRRITPGK